MAINKSPTDGSLENAQCVQASETPNKTQLDEFKLDVNIQERVKTGDKMKSYRVKGRENDSPQWEKMQKF